MRLQLPKIYPITDVRASGLSHVDQIHALVAAGASFFQIREKDVPPTKWIDEATAAVRSARENGTRVIINDRIDIAVSIHADGVHLGQDDVPPDVARRILGNSAIIGFSTHDIRQVREACRMPVDYIAFGPIFETGTKTDAHRTVGLEMLKLAKAEASDIPLVAIGGINHSNVVDVFDAGADSVAVISAVLDPRKGISANFASLVHLSLIA